MRSWSAIKRGDAAVGDGTEFAQNTRFYIDGELQRRHGLVKLATFGATSCRGARTFWHPNAGLFVIYAGADGTMQTAAAT